MLDPIGVPHEELTLIANNYNIDVEKGTVTNLHNGSVIVYYGCTTSDVIESINSTINDIKSLIENIEVTMHHFELMGATIKYVWSRYYEEHVPTFVHWPVIRPQRKGRSQLINNKLSTRGFPSGMPPRNRGRHFNRKVHWRIK